MDKVQISIYVPVDVKEKLRYLAEENGQMFSDYVRMILIQHTKHAVGNKFDKEIKRN